ncbi:MAG: hypothetical protein BGO88_12950 [Flavobacterium sp. 38-13]|uniref:hypothetical protein n=1 Tax=Flavobacterium sp. 38-13 TaxID=1896168 RepID=UPI00095CF515|nr:hypothetical protein [Flavobacterium sp. 38-13]OJX52727.1 MAG: hypothetical protein BGO88_12950 [Flavobacterium sp. 38-13]
MALFHVIEIIDGSTIKVPSWKYGEERGQLVRIHGYSVPTDPIYQTYVKKKLESLLKDKFVELKRALGIEKNNKGENIIRCSVYLNEIDISTYFRELDIKK